MRSDIKNREGFDENRLEAIQTTLAGIMFGLTLGAFLYKSQELSGIQDYVFYFTSFLIMIRLWFRYVSFFGKLLPSKTMYEYSLDFIIALSVGYGVMSSQSLTWFLVYGFVFFLGGLKYWSVIKYSKGKVNKYLSSRIWLELAIVFIFAIFYILSKKYGIGLYLGSAIAFLGMLYIFIEGRIGFLTRYDF
ncbi:hypothetical protein ACFLW8_04165 [Chloroflexota bacterium]